MFVPRVAVALLLAAAATAASNEQCERHCTDLVIGQKSTGKRVCTSMSGSNMTVEYPVVPGQKYDEVHVYLGVEAPKKQAPGKFPFSSNNGYCSVVFDGSYATCKIPLDAFGKCDQDYHIATHAAMKQGETGWGDGPCISDNCKPWVSVQKKLRLH